MARNIHVVWLESKVFIYLNVLTPRDKGIVDVGSRSND